MKKPKIALLLVSLLIMTVLATGNVFANEQLNYNQEEYLDVVDLFWSVD